MQCENKLFIIITIIIIQVVFLKEKHITHILKCMLYLGI
jgi:hypothetical protein